MKHYIMSRSGKIIGTEDIVRWAAWFKRADRKVATTMVGDIFVSTVFLGIDHNFLQSGPPVLFETMVFGGAHDQWQSRSSTKLDSVAEHNAAVKMVRQSLNLED